MSKTKIGKMNQRLIVEKQDIVTRDLAGGFLDTWYPALNDVSDLAEANTTTTTIKIAGHGMTTGDYITNVTRDSVVREVTVADVDTLTVSAVTAQVSGDTITLHKYTTSKVWGHMKASTTAYVDEDQKRKIISVLKLRTRYRTDFDKRYRFKLGTRTFQILSFYNDEESNYYMYFELREVL